MEEDAREDREYEAHREDLEESIDGGGCAETWEALSEKRARTDDTAGKSSPDLEDVLLETDCLRFTDDGADLALTSSFREAWRTETDDLENMDLGPVVADAFAVDGAVEIEATDRAVHARTDGRVLGQWVSQAAMVADLAACRVLEDRDDDWADRSPGERSRFAGGLRLYLEFCPDCGGRASFDTETVTSCCNEYEVATVSCEACGETLLEIPVEAD